jgi:hypothetical protein
VRPIPLAAALVAAVAASARAGTVDEDLVPGGKVLSTIFPTAEVERFRIAAPAGSTLLVDLRPGARGGFAPSCAATLSDGSGAQVPLPGRTGRTRAKLPFPEDGVLELLVLSGRGGAGDYVLSTRLRPARGPDFAGTVEGPEGVAIAYMAPAGSLATVTVRSSAASGVIPMIQSVNGPGGDVEPAKRRANPRFDQWLMVPQPASGPWTLTVVGNLFTTGEFSGSIRWKPPKGPDEDHREVSDNGALLGSHGTLLAGATFAGGSLPNVLAGGTVLDGKGGARTTLDSLALAFDAAAPLGLRLDPAPVGPRRGSYYTDGTLASVSLDLGEGQAIGSDFQVAAGATVLHTGTGPEPSPADGLLLARTEVPAAADLAGTWHYVNTAAVGSGTSTIEIGTLTLGAGGTVGGQGTRTQVDLVGGTPTPGAGTPVERAGSFAVAGDGRITVTTVADGAGPSEAWTCRTASGADILAGLDGPGGGWRLIARRGTGLSAADASGDYLHFAVGFGSTLTLRTGVLAFDGAGAFAGTETVTDLAGGSLASTGPVTGTYSVNGEGVATFGIDGGAQGSGIAGPGARYLFSVSLGGAGVGLDLLLDLE